MFLVCESKNTKTLVVKETAQYPSAIYSEYNITSKTVNVTSNAVLLIFSAQISNPLGLNINLLFNINRFSDSQASQTIGSTYIYSSSKKDNAKTFSFQFLDNDITPGSYTYSISAAANCFTNISPGLIIPTYTLNFITGN